YVTDLIEGIYRLLLSDEVNPVNIGNPVERTVLDFARLILKLMDSNRKIIFKELPQDDPKVRRPDISRARELLGWEPVVDIEEGLRNTIEYFRKSRKVSGE
ncbi:MAG: SDR family NAD-dependent epimerase/dehydratase, partial [Candidatus Eremiobacterota bacterium]